MTQSDNSILDLVVSYIFSSADEEKKISLLREADLSFGRDIPMLGKIYSLKERTGEWPTFEHVVTNLRFSGSLVEVQENLNVADLLDSLEKVKEEENKTKLATELFDIAKNVNSLNLNDVVTRINEAASKIEVREKRSEGEYDPRKAYKEDAQQPAGLLTFVPPIDEALGGVRKGHMLSLGAFVGSFKTTEAINMTHGNVTKTGQNGVILSLEMPKKYLHYMMLSRHSFSPEMQQYGDPIENQKIIRTLLNEEEEDFVFGKVRESLEAKENGRFMVLDRTDFDSLDHNGITLRLRKIPFQIDFIVVDYAQRFKYIPEAKLYGGGNDAANHYIDYFLNVAVGKSLGYPVSVAMLAQTNRDGKKSADANNGRYDISALAELNSLDRDSAYIMFQYKDANLLESNELKVSLPKNRFGNVIEEPVTTYVDPKYCVIGEEIEGFSDEGVASGFSDMLFGGGDPFSL